MNGDMAGAATGFQKALDLNPRQAPALRNLAWLRAEQNHPLEALALLKTCVERNPGHGAGWQDYGLLLEGTGHPDEAIGAFQRALELQPRFDVSANRLGIIHFVRRDWERARAFFARAHQFRPESGEYRWNLACSLRAMGLAQESHALVKGFPAQIQLTPNMVVPPDAVPERMTP
jgi:superkiller protein 3